MSSFMPSVIRTVVPYIIGWVISGLALLGISSVPEEVSSWLSGVLAFLIGTAWYLLVRWLERKWPWLGVFLGIPRQPQYESKKIG